MNGLRYWRLKRRMSYTVLAKESGVSGSTIHNLEESLEHVYSDRLVRLADALDITVDDLVREYPEDSVGPGDHPKLKYTMDEDRLNPVGRFCRLHNISLPEYTTLAGKKSKQASLRVWTKRKLKPEEILPLAQMEGLSIEGFLLRYGKEENSDHKS